MHHLAVDIGWQTLALAAVLLILAAPALIRWARFEIRLARRGRTLTQRTREGFPFS